MASEIPNDPFADQMPMYPPSQCLIEAILRQAKATPDRVIASRLRPERRSFAADPLTYRQLIWGAVHFSETLDKRGVKAGDRILLSLADPRKLLVSVIGAMSKGIISVPLQTVEEFRSPRVFRERVNGIIRDARPVLAIIENQPRWHALMEDESVATPLDDAPLLTAGQYDDLPFESALTSLAIRAASGPAFIQYTSGSTGDPRGVVITHGNLVANIWASGQAGRATRRDRFISWLPLHHDMGLVGSLLYPLGMDIPTHLLAPMSFLMRPVSWLQAIMHLKATITVAPTFAFSLCWRKIPQSQLQGLDLSSLRLAYCGAEPIDIRVVEGFSKRFAPYGFRPDTLFPVYGLAEATLSATFPEPGHPPTIDRVSSRRLCEDGIAVPASTAGEATTTYICVGRALPGHGLRIVDTGTGKTCPERTLGEIHLTGPSISPGYYSEQPYNADKTRSEVPLARTELATGDLGYLANGNLYVIDRLKDVIIVRGQNFSPADLERFASSTPGLRAGRLVAFSSTDGDEGECVHMLCELSPATWRRQRAIIADVQQRIVEHFSITLASVTLVAPGTLPRTSSGKVRRQASRELYLRQRFRQELPLSRRLVIKVRRPREILTLMLRRRLARLRPVRSE